MKLLLINTPNRVNPCEFPPYACLSLMKYLKKNGYKDDELDFYNVDYHRPELDELLEIIKEKKPDVLGISAVVSTSYKFTKEISLLVKKELPDTKIIVGGNLAASAEILLRKTGTDFCVLGEGENILLDFMNRVQDAGSDFSRYRNIKGLVFVNNDGEIISTGYGNDLPKEELYDIDWSDLKESTSHYIFDLFDNQGNVTVKYFGTDKRVFEPHRRNKKCMVFIIGKGCVAKCTFCHRWDKGIRHIPIDILMERLDELIEKYNVGFVSPQIEALGCDKKWLYELCGELKKRNVLWYAGAVRAKSMSQELIDKMDESGCTSIIYGLETGSRKMLEVMEKKTSLEENMKAQELTINKGYYSTVLQFVLGMPGESPETIKESSEFSQFCMTLNKWTNPHDLSINYVQALPGTPLYEFARKKGLIGISIEDEEKYLLDVSDKNATDPIAAINFTEYPVILYWSWKYKIYLETIYAYINKYGKRQYFLMTMKSDENTPLIDLINQEVKQEHIKVPSLLRLVLSKNLKGLIKFYPVLLYRLRSLLPLFMLASRVKILGFRKSFEYLKEYLLFLIGCNNESGEVIKAQSLRKTVDTDLPPIKSDSIVMIPLRKGRW